MLHVAPTVRVCVRDEGDSRWPRHPPLSRRLRRESWPLRWPSRRRMRGRALLLRWPLPSPRQPSRPLPPPPSLLRTNILWRRAALRASETRQSREERAQRRGRNSTGPPPYRPTEIRKSSCWRTTSLSRKSFRSSASPEVSRAREARPAQGRRACRASGGARFELFVPHSLPPVSAIIKRLARRSSFLADSPSGRFGECRSSHAHREAARIVFAPPSPADEEDDFADPPPPPRPPRKVAEASIDLSQGASVLLDDELGAVLIDDVDDVRHRHRDSQIATRGLVLVETASLYADTPPTRSCAQRSWWPSCGGRPSAHSSHATAHRSRSPRWPHRVARRGARSGHPQGTGSVCAGSGTCRQQQPPMMRGTLSREPSLPSLPPACRPRTWSPPPAPPPAPPAHRGAWVWPWDRWGWGCPGRGLQRPLPAATALPASGEGGAGAIAANGMGVTVAAMVPLSPMMSM